MVRLRRSYASRLAARYEKHSWVVVATTPPIRHGKVLRQEGNELVTVHTSPSGVDVLARIRIEAVDFMCQHQYEAERLRAILSDLVSASTPWTLEDVVQRARQT